MKSIGKTIFGVDFTPEQWAAVRLSPPLWQLDPPQREEYDSDYDYAIGEREYADRVIAARKRENERSRNVQ